MNEGLSRLERVFRELLIAIGEDPSREGLIETPLRAAKAWYEELTVGYRINPKELIKSFDIECDGCVEVDDLIIVKDIPVRSMCEHHLLPFIGFAHIAYIPRDRVLGLSKLARIVDAFSRRLQIQERLTNQVADFIYEGLNPKGVMVMINAYHTCTMIRGVNEALYLVSIATRGVFKDGQYRGEVINILNLLKASNPLESLRELGNG